MGFSRYCKERTWKAIKENFECVPIQNYIVWVSRKQNPVFWGCALMQQLCENQPQKYECMCIQFGMLRLSWKSSHVPILHNGYSFIIILMGKCFKKSLCVGAQIGHLPYVQSYCIVDLPQYTWLGWSHVLQIYQSI